MSEENIETISKSDSNSAIFNGHSLIKNNIPILIKVMYICIYIYIYVI